MHSGLPRSIWTSRAWKQVPLPLFLSMCLAHACKLATLVQPHSHAERLGAAQVTMTDWAFLMYMLQDGVNWWIWVLHFFGVFAGGMLLM